MGWQGRLVGDREGDLVPIRVTLICLVRGRGGEEEGMTSLREARLGNSCRAPKLRLQSSLGPFLTSGPWAVCVNILSIHIHTPECASLDTVVDLGVLCLLCA